jgi:hypothetical protein
VKRRVNDGGLRLHGEGLVSTSSESLRGKGRTEGCPKLLASRRSSSGQRTWWGPDGGRRIGPKP